MRDVLVVGDLVTDLLIATDRPPAPGTDTAGTIVACGGGQAANTAAWLASLGTPVTLIAAVGDDAAGRERVAELTATGVRCAVAVHPAPTGTVAVLSAAGDRTMITDRAAADLLAVGNLPDAAHLHLSGYVLLSPGSRTAGRQALTEAQVKGMTTSVDAASAGPLSAVGPAAFTDWVRGTELLLANSDEAALLETVAPLTSIARHVIVKHGAAGAEWRTADRRWTASAVPATVVAATGAGDAFAAGLLAAWLSGASPEESLRAGTSAGAAAVSRLGARP